MKINYNNGVYTLPLFTVTADGLTATGNTIQLQYVSGTPIVPTDEEYNEAQALITEYQTDGKLLLDSIESDELKIKLVNAVNTMQRYHIPNREGIVHESLIAVLMHDMRQKAAKSKQLSMALIKLEEALLWMTESNRIDGLVE